jgi:hypothetical protein
MKIFDAIAADRLSTGLARIVVVSGTEAPGSLLAITPEMTAPEIDAHIADLKRQLDEAGEKAKVICQ